MNDSPLSPEIITQQNLLLLLLSGHEIHELKVGSKVPDL
jgi:hypothetical protein